MKRFFRLGFALIIFLGLCYITLWAYSYQWLQKEIDRVYAEAPQHGFEFLGPKPVITGFPFIPEIYYGGGLKTGNTLLFFPESRLRGYPIPGLTFHLSVPRGLSLEVIAPAGRKVVGVTANWSNPYVDAAPRIADRDAMLADVAEGRVDEFERLADARGVTHVVGMGAVECGGMERIGLRLMYRFGEVCVFARGR